MLNYTNLNLLLKMEESSLILSSDSEESETSNLAGESSRITGAVIGAIQSNRFIFAIVFVIIIAVAAIATYSYRKKSEVDEE